MITAAAFLCLAAAGAVGRGVIGHRLNVHGGFPFGTLIVNLAGALILGLLHDVAPPRYTVLGTGMLGAFTTFSSFARDGVALVEQRRFVMAIVYGVVSLGGAILGAAGGVALAS